MKPLKLAFPTQHFSHLPFPAYQQEVTKLDFRPNATKICMMISDAPPHGLGCSGDGFPKGCPAGLDPVKISHTLAEMGVTLYCVGCEPSINPYKSFFEALAFNTGGQYCPLQSAQGLSGLVVASAREEIHLERLMGDMDGMLSDLPSEATEEQKKTHLFQKMQARSVQVQTAVASSGAKQAISSKARNMTKAGNMDDLRTAYLATPEEASAAAAAAPSSSYFSSRSSSSSRPELSSSSSSSSRSGSLRKKTASIASGVTGWLSSLFGGSSSSSSPLAAATESEAAPYHACYATDASCDDMVAAAAAPSPAMEATVASSEGLSYSSKADFVSMEQCERMLSKHSARKSKI